MVDLTSALPFERDASAGAVNGKDCAGQSPEPVDGHGALRTPSGDWFMSRSRAAHPSEPRGQEIRVGHRRAGRPKDERRRSDWL